MNNNQTFSILFWIERRRLENGHVPLNARITVNGKRADISTQRKIVLLEWDQKAQVLISKSPESKEINNHLAIMKSKILACQSKLEARGERVTAEAIKNEYIGKRPERKMLLDVFNFKLKRIDEEVKMRKTSQATYNKYDDTYNHLKKFLNHNFKVADKYLDEIDFSFIADFEHYLSVTKGLANNAAMKYVSITKSIFRMANTRGWLPVNPVASFSCSFNYGEPMRLELHHRLHQDKQLTMRLRLFCLVPFCIKRKCYRSNRPPK